MNDDREAALGGVLSDGAIRAEVDARRLIVCGFKPQSLKPASYDVTVAGDGLWRDQTKPSLGFLSDLKQLKDSSERNRDLIAFVIFGGIFVLLMTLISVFAGRDPFA